MKKPIGGFAALGILALLLIVAQVQAQTAGRAKTPRPARYDAAREVTIEGSVASLVTKPTRGMLAGAHVILSTSTGTVDAHLGNYALVGQNALTLTSGEHVRFVGLMTTVHGNPVFLVRTAQTANGVHVVRNTHGFLIQPGAASLQERRDAGKKGGRP